MHQTTNLQLPYIMPSQAQKHVTHNEAIRMLDALVQLTVLDRDLSTPPASPSEGSRYLVAPDGVGEWAGKDGQIAVFQDGAWAFLAPQPGWVVWVADEWRLLSYDGEEFIDAAVHSVNPVPLVGVNTTADLANRLSVKSPASLFDHEDGGHRLRVNKALPADTASLLFQSGYSGRAELGLTGDDDWTVKVSADGDSWIEAMKADAASGRVTLPSALPLDHDDQIVTGRHVRPRLTANRTYYVRTDGSDSNDGLTNLPGGAFLTIQKAIDVAAALDTAIYDVTIQLAAGTYPTSTGNVLKSAAGAGKIIIVGDEAMPANVEVTVNGAMSTTDGIFLSVANKTTYAIRGVKLTSTATSVIFGIVASSGSLVEFQNLDFGAFSGAGSNQHIRAEDNGIVRATGNYSISGGAGLHWSAVNATIRCQFITMSLAGTPAFTQFVSASDLSFVIANGTTFSGSATGQRYSVVSNSVLKTNGGGASYIPGDASGVTGTGGQYT